MSDAHRSVYPILPTRDTVGYPPNVQLGMTIRQHYAGLAMQAIINGHVARHGATSFRPEGVAELAFKMADAMAEAE